MVEAGSHTGPYSMTGVGAATNKRDAIQRGKDLTEKRRITTQILRNGLNIAVFSSIFDQDEDLKARLGGSERSRLIYNSLCPVFNEGFDFNVQMDSKVFDYLKNKKAVFEIRHYIKNPKDSRDHGNLTHSFLEGSKIEGD